MRTAHSRLQSECQALQDERRRQNELLGQLEDIQKSLERVDNDEKNRMVRVSLSLGLCLG